MKHKDNHTDHLASLCLADAQVIDEILELMAEEPSLKLTDTDSAVGTDPPPPHDNHLKQRTRKISQIMSLIQQCPVSPAPDDLLQRTLARINEAKQQKRFTQQVEALKAPRPGYGWSRELVSVAAVLMIGFSLLWPALDRARVQLRRSTTTHNELALAGTLLGLHHDGEPTSQNNPWWNVSQALNSTDYPLSAIASNEPTPALKQKNKNHQSLRKNRFGSYLAYPPKAHPNISPRYRKQPAAPAILFDHRHGVAILTNRPPSFVNRSDHGVAAASYWGVAPNPHNMQALSLASHTPSDSKHRPNSMGENLWLNRVTNRNANAIQPHLTTENPFFVSVSNQY